MEIPVRRKPGRPMMRGIIFSLLMVLLAASAIPASADPILSQTVTEEITFTNITATLMISGTIDISAEGAINGQTFVKMLSKTDVTENPGTSSLTITDQVPAGTTDFITLTSLFDQIGDPVDLCPAAPQDSTPMACLQSAEQNSLITNTIDPANNYPQVEHDPTLVGVETIEQTVSSTPEPSSGGLMMIGVGLLGLMMVRRKRKAKELAQAA